MKFKITTTDVILVIIALLIVAIAALVGCIERGSVALPLVLSK
jgi:hypothetical protein